MMLRLAAALLVCVLGTVPARAQTAGPSPSPAPTPLAFHARAHGDVAVVTAGATYAIHARIAVAQRDRLSRIDLLSIQSETLPIPSPALTFVLDRAANTLTIWNAASKTYFTQAFLTIASLPVRAVPARPAIGRSPFADLDVLAISLSLTNHTTTAGLAITGFALAADVRKTSETATSHFTATIQLADDFAAFPVTVEASIVPGAGAFRGRFAYAVDDFVKGPSDASDFAVPSGFSRAASALDVVLGRSVGAPIRTRS